MRRFFVEKELNAEAEATITGDEAHHIKTVLRMQVGDFIELVDGSGYTYLSQIKKTTGDQIRVYVQKKYDTGAESTLRLTIAIGFLKEKKMDFLVRHLTELGISRFLPILTARSVAKPSDKRVSGRLNRWQAIAKEAVKQSRRVCIPEILKPVSFNEALQLSKPSDKKIICRKDVESALNKRKGRQAMFEDVFVMIGPEGGFTGEEALTAGEQGFIPFSMGPRVLRAETAAIAACTLIQYLFGDIRKKSP